MAAPCGGAAGRVYSANQSPPKEINSFGNQTDPSTTTTNFPPFNYPMIPKPTRTDRRRADKMLAERPEVKHELQNLAQTRKANAVLNDAVIIAAVKGLPASRAFKGTGLKLPRLGW